MIHRLEIENFYSIREKQAIDLRIGAKVPDEEGRFGQINDGSGDRIPKTVAMFGANASGKSNVLKALAFLRWFLVESFEIPPDGPLPILRFADGNSLPIRIKVHFDWVADLSNLTLDESASFAQYTYEVCIGRGAVLPYAVLSEELRLQPPSGKSRRVFVRGESGQVESGSGFSLKGLNHILAKLRPNVSVTATIAQFAQHTPTAILLAWAKRISSNILFEKNAPIDSPAVFQYYAKRPHLVEALNGQLKRVDLGIKEMSIVNTAGGPQCEFKHAGLQAPLWFLFESEGTRQFVRVFPVLWEALQLGGISLVDEIDSTIHPMLLPEILRWFYDPEVNPHQAQLWFSGHSASLLEELRKEEILFTEKDAQGHTRIFALKEIDGVRRVDNFYQKYLGGVYGAVPRIG
jgi:hypothetical protein